MSDCYYMYMYMPFHDDFNLVCVHTHANCVYDIYWGARVTSPSCRGGNISHVQDDEILKQHFMLMTSI